MRSQSLDRFNISFGEDEGIAEVASEEACAETPPAEGKTPGQRSRKPLRDHLDRHDEVLSPGEDCARCGGRLKMLGEGVTKELVHMPGCFVVKRISNRCCPRVPFERGRPDPGLLAHVLVNKYADHLPLPRQSQIYARKAVDLYRSITRRAGLALISSHVT